MRQYSVRYVHPVSPGDDVLALRHPDQVPARPRHPRLRKV